MTHHSRLYVAVIDVPADDYADQISFWGAATGHPMRELDAPEFHGARLNDNGALIVQRIDEGDARVHLDFHTDDLDAEVARLQGLGATVDRRTGDEWVVMTDPSGLEFCVVVDPRGTLTDDNSNVWT
ncbi:MAG: glyoxalase/bleomycin resistance/dioxygenase family protein [Acidimicrobiaceae bacterium]|nr:glyoxalase/bleomycin resistance/dioxygenase family protein [Acidimicrobiaceae bacterium]